MLQSQLGAFLKLAESPLETFCLLASVDEVVQGGTYKIDKHFPRELYELTYMPWTDLIISFFISSLSSVFLSTYPGSSEI